MNQHFTLPRLLVDREAFIVSRCTGRRVLHVGCADYPLTKLRLESGTLLHNRLCEASSDVTGIDTNGESLELLRNAFPGRPLICADAQRISTLNLKPFDVIVLGEVIEHVPNPGLVLRALHGAAASGGELIISTVNAYCLRRMLRIPFGVESIHPDHLYYFSHRVLETLANVCNWNLTFAAGYRLPNANPLLPYVIERLASIISPNLCEGLVHTYAAVLPPD